MMTRNFQNFAATPPFRLIAPLIVALMGIPPSLAEIIPADRRITWEVGTNVGVPGGIPDRQTIGATVDASAYGDGLTDAAPAIKAAISACPTGQVVFLPAGTYRTDSTITLSAAKQITIRGAGIGQTIIKPSAKHRVFETPQSGRYSPLPINATIAKGTTSFTADAVTKAAPGKLIQLICDLPSYGWSRNSDIRDVSHRAVITSVVGKTVNFSPPVAEQFPLSASPTFEVDHYLRVRQSGIEDLTIDQTGISLPDYTIWFSSTYGCWVKGVELRNFGAVGIMVSRSIQDQIQNCSFNGSTSTSDGYAIEAISFTTGLYVVDNWATDCWSLIITNQLDGGVIAYNYHHTSKAARWARLTGVFNSNHGPHGYMNLWEGNVGEQWQNDGYHGSSSHLTVFRNWFHGLHTNPASSYTENRKMIDLCRFSRYHNVVGNVLGDASWAPTYYDRDPKASGYVFSCIYRLGYPNIGNNGFSSTNPPTVADAGGLDPEVENTLLRHGNFDYFNKSIVWDGSIEDHDIPDSLYLNGKPSWFKSLAWPPFDPASPADASRDDIPAGYRFLNKMDPPPVNPANLRVKKGN